MPRPRAERQAIEEELAELPAQIAKHKREIAATPPQETERRENLEWRIRRDEKRVAELRARLAVNTEGD
jgi:chromosome segregation ATPase